MEAERKYAAKERGCLGTMEPLQSGPHTTGSCLSFPDLNEGVLHALIHVDLQLQENPSWMPFPHDFFPRPLHMCCIKGHSQVSFLQYIC